VIILSAGCSAAGLAQKIIDEGRYIRTCRCPHDTSYTIDFTMDGIVFTTEGNVRDVSFVDPNQMTGKRNRSLGEIHDQVHLTDRCGFVFFTLIFVSFPSQENVMTVGSVACA
jgi:hypothetical protein